MTYTTVILSELLSETKKNIYCFGAGQIFADFVNEFKTYNLEDNIKAVVDNNSNIVNFSVKTVCDVNIPIISFEEMIGSIKKDDKILITTVAYEEIIEQIKKTKKIDNILYYIYPILRIEQYDYDRLNIPFPQRLTSCENIQIPKTIHYCWFGNKEMPSQYKKWMESWRKYCSDYKIIEKKKKNYDVHKSKYISQAYEMKQWAFVSDYARIDIINQYGGVYLDVDVELKKNIDEMLMNDAFCGFESNEYVNFGLGFGAKKNNSIIGEIKEYYDNTSFIQSDGRLNRTSCPLIQTEIMKSHGLQCNGKFQIVDGMAVYPSRILCGMSPHSFRVERNLEHTYAIHHFEGSWVEDKSEKNMLISAMKKWSRDDNYIYPNSLN